MALPSQGRGGRCGQHDQDVVEPVVAPQGLGAGVDRQLDGAVVVGARRIVAPAVGPGGAVRQERAGRPGGRRPMISRSGSRPAGVAWSPSRLRWVMPAAPRAQGGRQALGADDAR